MSETIDTPITRASINQMTVDQQDQLLLSIRARRLEKIKKLEKLAHVRADDTQLLPFIRFERAIAAARKEFEKLEAQERKADAALHKARVLAIECEAGGYISDSR